MPRWSFASAAILGLSIAKPEIRVKQNWQDEWRNDLNKCVVDNIAIFRDSAGKPRTRKLDEMADLISNQIVGNVSPPSPPPSTKTAKTVEASKLSKKERMKRELKQELRDDLGAVFQQMDSAKSNTAYYQRVKEQGEQMILQMSRQSKLPLDTDVTLREWCDIVWRSGRFSPLDQDQPKKLDEDNIPDLDDVEEDSSKSSVLTEEL
ncbi:Uncharacterized protein SCF082_LOCUS13481 [Durusdinium trenchii]|uniref:Uncharacterized protein n=1 Tax=Durusdinium trenchii TaxID=1381693 RepID=A0ABP0JSR0_9DINO